MPVKPLKESESMETRSAEEILAVHTAMENEAEKVREMTFELERRKGEMPADKIKALNQIIRIGENVGDETEFFGYSEMLYRKIIEGGKPDEGEAQNLQEKRRSFEEKIREFYRLYNEKGFGDLMLIEGGETEAPTPPPEVEKSIIEIERPSPKAREAGQFDALGEKIKNQNDTLDSLLRDIKKIEKDAKEFSLSEKLVKEIDWNKGVYNRAVESMGELLTLFHAAKSAAAGNETPAELELRIKNFDKKLYALRNYMLSTSKGVEEEIDRRRTIDGRLAKVEERLKNFVPADPDNKKMRDDILKQMVSLKSMKLDETAISNLEALVENRILMPEKQQRAKEARATIKDGLKKYYPRLEQLLQAFQELASVSPQKKTSVEIAHDLYLELDRDLKSIGPENAGEQMAKFEEFKRQLVLVEKQFEGPIETEVVRRRVKKLLAKLEAAKNNPDLPAKQKDMVEKWLANIPNVKTNEDVAKFEELINEVAIIPLTKKAIIKEREEKSEKEFYKKGKEKYGAPAPGEVEKKAKYGIKEILAEKGVINIDPSEFLGKISPASLAELAGFVHNKDSAGAEALLRGLVRELTPSVAAEQREAIGRKINEILSVAIEGQVQAEIAKLKRRQTYKKIGAKLTANMGVALGIGIGVGAAIGSGGLAAAITGGTIATVRLLNKNKFLNEKIGQSEKVKKAKERATSLWQSVGNLFKKEKPPVEADELRAKIIEEMISQKKLAEILSNEIRANTSAETVKRVLEYPQAREAALADPSKENIARFSEVLDDASYNFYLNALNFVSVEYAGQNLSDEEKAKMATMIALTLGIKERGEIKEAKQFKELREQAKTTVKPEMVKKFEKFQKFRSEGFYSIGFGMATSYAIRASATGRIISGALGGMAGGLWVESATRSDAAAKAEKVIDKMIADTEKKIAGKETGQLSEKDIMKAAENAAKIQSNIDHGVLDENPMLKSRAEGFIFRVRVMQFEMLEVKNKSIIKAVKENTDIYEKQNKKALKKLHFLSPGKRQLLFMAGGALAGAALGAAGALLAEHFRAPAKPHEIAPTAEPPTPTGVRPVGYSVTPLEGTVKHGDEMNFTEEDVAKYQAELAAAKGAVKHAAHGGLAELRAHHAPAEFHDLQKAVGHNTAEWVQFLDKNNYHKLSQDLYNAKLNLHEYGARAVGNAAMAEKTAELSQRFDQAEELLRNHKYAEAGKVLRDISRSALHEKEKVFEAPIEKTKFETFEEIYRKPKTPAAERPLDTYEEVYGRKAAAPVSPLPEVPGNLHPGGPIADAYAHLREAGENDLADKVILLGRDIHDYRSWTEGFVERGLLPKGLDVDSQYDKFEAEYNHAIELFNQGKTSEAGQLLNSVDEQCRGLYRHFTDQVIAAQEVAAMSKSAQLPGVEEIYGPAHGAVAGHAVEAPATAAASEAAHAPEHGAPHAPAEEPKPESAAGHEEHHEEHEEEHETQAEEPKPEKPTATADTAAAAEAKRIAELALANKQMDMLTHLPKAQQGTYYWLTNQIAERPGNAKLQGLKDKFLDEMTQGHKRQLSKVVSDIEALRKK